MACLGEAQGGSPYNGDEPVIAISNPGKINRTFKAGDLREAGQLLFDPSVDEAIPGGAQEVKFVKVNPATRSALTLQNGDGDSTIWSSLDYGIDTTQISIDISDGTVQGKAVTVVFQDDTEVYDDLGGDAVFTLAYAPGADGASSMIAGLDPAAQLDASFTKATTGLADDYVGQISGISGLDGDALSAIGAGNVAQVLSSSAADTTQSVTVYGINNGTGLPDSEVIPLDGTNGTTPVAGTTTWTTVHGAVLDAVAVGSVTIEDGTTTTDLYIITAASTTTGGGMHVFAEAIEAANEVISLVSTGASVAQVLVVGVASGGAPTIEAVTLTGTTPVLSTVAWESISALALGLFEAAQATTVEGLLLDSGDTLSIVSDNAGDTQAGVVYGVDTVGAAQSEAFTLTGVTPVALTSTWSKVLAVTVASAAGGSITLSAPTESITLFVLTVGETSQGFVLVENAAVSGVLSGVLDAVGAHSVLLIGLDQAQVALLEEIETSGTTPVPGTVNTWSGLTGLAVGHVPNARTFTASGKAFDLDTSSYPTVAEVSDFISTLPGWTFTEGSNVRGIAMADLDTTAAATVLSASLEFFGDLLAILDEINQASLLVSVAAAPGATGAPNNTAVPVFLVGGSEGTTTFADWQAALDLLREQFVNTVVVITDDEAVHAAVASHCRYMASVGRKERDAILGAAPQETKSEIKARAVALNTRHCRLLHQDVVRINTSGSREQFPPSYNACIAAGMQAGSPAGTPLTFKFLNALDVVGNDASYTITDDGEELIRAGLMSVEQVPNVGFRYLRNITTYLIDPDNIAYTEASANEAVNVSVFNLRTNLEAMVGRVGSASTVNAAVGIAVSTLGQLMAAGTIVDWRALTITLEADVMTLDVELAPVLPVNFVKSTIHLVTASFSAAA